MKELKEKEEEKWFKQEEKIRLEKETLLRVLLGLHNVIT